MHLFKEAVCIIYFTIIDFRIKLKTRCIFFNLNKYNQSLAKQAVFLKSTKMNLLIQILLTLLYFPNLVHSLLKVLWIYFSELCNMAHQLMSVLICLTVLFMSLIGKIHVILGNPVLSQGFRKHFMYFWFPNGCLYEWLRLASLSSVLFPGVPARISMSPPSCSEMWPSACILPSGQECRGHDSF